MYLGPLETRSRSLRYSTPDAHSVRRIMQPCKPSLPSSPGLPSSPFGPCSPDMRTGVAQPTVGCNRLLLASISACVIHRYSPEESDGGVSLQPAGVRSVLTSAGAVVVLLFLAYLKSVCGPGSPSSPVTRIGVDHAPAFPVDASIVALDIHHIPTPVGASLHPDGMGSDEVGFAGSVSLFLNT